MSDKEYAEIEIDLTPETDQALRILILEKLDGLLTPTAKTYFADNPNDLSKAIGDAVISSVTEELLVAKINEMDIDKDESK